MANGRSQRPFKQALPRWPKRLQNSSDSYLRNSASEVYSGVMKNEQQNDMNEYNFSKYATEMQRDLLVMSLRHAGFAASREMDILRTNASRTTIGLVMSNGQFLLTFA